MSEYPTEEELQKIREWKCNDFSGLLAYIYGIYCFNYGEYVWNENNYFSEVVLVTGGWSGNEDIISAMIDNTGWWCNYWDSSHRGGKYIFKKEN